MKRIASIFSVLCLFAPQIFAGALVQVPLADMQLQVVTGRVALVTCLSVPRGASSMVVVQDRRKFTSDTNGTIWITNAITGKYVIEVQGPPDTTRFAFLITDTNGTINVANGYMVADAGNSLPPDSVSYGAAASDHRYVLRSETLSANGIAAGTNMTIGTNTGLYTLNADVGHAEVQAAQAAAGAAATNYAQQLSLAGTNFTLSTSNLLWLTFNAAAGVTTGQLSTATNFVSTNLISQINIASNLLWLAGNGGTNDLNTALLARFGAGTNTVTTNLAAVINAGTNKLSSDLITVLNAASNVLWSAGVRGTNDLNTVLSALIATATNQLNSSLVTAIGATTNNLSTNLISQINIASNLLWLAGNGGTNDLNTALLARFGAGTNTVTTNLAAVINAGTNKLSSDLITVLNAASNVLWSAGVRGTNDLNTIFIAALALNTNNVSTNLIAVLNATSNSIIAQINTNSGITVAQLGAATNSTSTNLIAVMNAASNVLAAAQRNGTNDLLALVIAYRAIDTNSVSTNLIAYFSTGTNSVSTNVLAQLNAASNILWSAGVRGTNDLFTLLNASLAASTNSVSTNLISQINISSNLLFVLVNGNLAASTNSVSTNVLAQLNSASNILWSAGLRGTNDILSLVTANQGIATNFVSTNVLAQLNAVSNILWIAANRGTNDLSTRLLVSMVTSNFYIGGNPVLVISTNDVAAYGAGESDANGTYEWVDSPVFSYTNLNQRGCFLYFQSPTWFIRRSSTNLYSFTSPFTGAGGLAVTAPAPVPSIGIGYDHNMNGERLLGIMNSSNLQQRLDALSSSLSQQISSSFGVSTNIVLASSLGVQFLPSRTNIAGGVSCWAQLQGALDRATNFPNVPFELKIDGIGFLNDHKSLVLYSNQKISGIGKALSGLVMGTSNNVPMIRNQWNTNFGSGYLEICNMFLEQRGTNQANRTDGSGACTIPITTNLYTSCIAIFGGSNVYIHDIDMPNPTAYGVFVMESYNVEISHNDIDFNKVGTCGQDCIHISGAWRGGLVIEGNILRGTGDMIALNMSETVQWVKSSYWSTNINTGDLCIIRGNRTKPITGSLFGNSFINVQTEDDAWSKIGTLIVDNNYVPRVCLPFRKTGRIDNLYVTRLIVDAYEGGTGDGEQAIGSATTNLIVSGCSITHASSTSSSAMLGGGGSITKFENLNIHAITGDILTDVNGNTQPLSISGVTMQGGDSIIIDANDLDDLLAGIPLNSTTPVNISGSRIIGGGRVNNYMMTNVVGDSVSWPITNDVVMNTVYTAGNDTTIYVTVRGTNYSTAFLVDTEGDGTYELSGARSAATGAATNQITISVTQGSKYYLTNFLNATVLPNSTTRKRQ